MKTKTIILTACVVVLVVFVFINQKIPATKTESRPAKHASTNTYRHYFAWTNVHGFYDSNTPKYDWIVGSNSAGEFVVVKGDESFEWVFNPSTTNFFKRQFKP